MLIQNFVIHFLEHEKLEINIIVLPSRDVIFRTGTYLTTSTAFIGGLELLWH